MQVSLDFAPALAPAPVAATAPVQEAGSVPWLLQAPETLHPALWRAHQLGRSQQAVAASGFAELDAQLPGGGWPAGALTELLLPHPGIGELRLLAPVLAALQHQQRSVIWFDPPASPCAWALAALGINLRQLVIVRARQGFKSAPRPTSTSSGPQGGMSKVAEPHLLMSRARERLPAADMLWALEHALKSGQLGAVLAWLPARLPADALRRLQLAAQGHAGPAFLLRGSDAQLRPSAAPLRIALASAGPDALRVVLLKRRGPPLAQPLMLALPPVLSPPALARALRATGPAHALARHPSAAAVATAGARA